MVQGRKYSYPHHSPYRHIHSFPHTSPYRHTIVYCPTAGQMGGAWWFSVVWIRACLSSDACTQTIQDLKQLDPYNDYKCKNMYNTQNCTIGIFIEFPPFTTILSFLTNICPQNEEHDATQHWCWSSTSTTIRTRHDVGFTPRGHSGTHSNVCIFVRIAPEVDWNGVAGRLKHFARLNAVLMTSTNLIGLT